MNRQTFDIEFETILIKSALDKKYLAYNIRTGLYTNSITRKLLSMFNSGNLTPKEVHEYIQSLN